LRLRVKTRLFPNAADGDYKMKFSCQNSASSASSARAFLFDCEFAGAALTSSRMSVQEIKEAARRLTAEERAEVAACLHSWTDDEWDKQMKRDAEAGKLNFLFDEAEAERQAGTLRKFPE
jgi:hypothetical protein